MGEYPNPITRINTLPCASLEKTTATMLSSNSKSTRRLKSAVIFLGIAEILALTAIVGALPQNSEEQHVRRLLRAPAVPRMDENGTEDSDVTISARSASTAAPSEFCRENNPRGDIQATNVEFADDCSSYIAFKPNKKSPCALWTEAMTGSNVQTTYDLTLAFTVPPMSMKIVIDDGPADTSITRTDGMWSVEAIMDTDDGDDFDNTGATLFDFEDETTHSDVFSAMFRDPSMDANTPIKVICH